VLAEADGPDEMEGLEGAEGLGGMEEAATEVAPQSDEESARELPTPDGKGSA
jgi:hypothetical protein